MRLFETVYYVYNRKLEELIGKSEDVPLRITIDLDKITRVGEWISDDQNLELLKDQCMVYTLSGESFLVGTSYEEMTEAWRNQQ